MKRSSLNLLGSGLRGFWGVDFFWERHGDGSVLIGETHGNASVPFGRRRRMGNASVPLGGDAWQCVCAVWEEERHGDASVLFGRRGMAMRLCRLRKYKKKEGSCEAVLFLFIFYPFIYFMMVISSMI